MCTAAAVHLVVVFSQNAHWSESHDGPAKTNSHRGGAFFARASFQLSKRRTTRRPIRSRAASALCNLRTAHRAKKRWQKSTTDVDQMHGVEAFVNAYQGASVAAIFKGLEEAGVPNNTALIFSELMDAKSLFLTANTDTIYFWVNLDVTKGPMVVETPPLSLGVVDDVWFRWVTDFGLPGPDRGEGGKYLFVPPDYQGELPESGYFVQKMRTKPALPCSGGLLSRTMIRSR